MRQQEQLRLEELTYFNAAEQGSQSMQTLPFLKSTFLILVNLLPLLHYYLPQVYLFTLILKVSYKRSCTFCPTSHCEFPKSPQHHLPHINSGLWLPWTTQWYKFLEYKGREPYAIHMGAWLHRDNTCQLQETCNDKFFFITFIISVLYMGCCWK